MVKKDFEYLAKIISRCYEIQGYKNNQVNDGIRLVMYTLTDQLEADYPNFNRDKFIQACQ